MTFPWLPLSLVEALLPELRAQDVSAVARGDAPSTATGGGFLTAYRAARGDPRRMATKRATAATSWAQRRDGFIQRHMAQVNAGREALWIQGAPTRRHLALAAWAYSPTPKRLATWLAEAQTRIPLRLNAGPRAVARWYRCQCGQPRAATLKITGKKYPKQSPRHALSPQDLKAFLREAEAFPEPVRSALRFLPATGLRIAEVCALRWAWIRGNQMRVLGKGTKWRTVTLSPEAQAVLRPLPRTSGVVFNGLSPGRVQRACRQITQALNLDVPLTPHVLRHTYATQLVRQCTPLPEVQALLGHDSFRTTLIYLHSLDL